METYNLSYIFSKRDFNFSAIYKITSPSGKIYIGQTQSLYIRYRKYRSCIANRYLKRAILKYGLDNMKVEILEKCIEVHKLDEREQFYLDTLQPFNERGYNICREAGTTRGVKPSAETIKKISDSNKGRPNPMYGKTHTKEAKDNMRLAKLGKKLSIKHRENMSKSRKGLGIKCVKQICVETGNILNTFSSINEAAESTNTSRTALSKVVNKTIDKRGDKEYTTKTAGGFYWEFCE